MQITLYESVENTRARAAQLSWDELVDELSEFQIGFDAKDDVPLWSPAIIEDGKRRNDRNVIGVSALVLDLDLTSETETFAAFDQLARFASVVHSTWSHDPDADLWRFRAVVQLSRVVQPAEWKQFWPRAVTTISIPVKTSTAGGVDPQCSAASNQYYVPALKTEDSPAIAVTYEGPPLDVDAVLASELSAPIVTAVEPPTIIMSKERMASFVKMLSRKRDSYSQEMADRFQRVLRGEPFAEPGERDDILFRMSSLIGERFPKYKPESIASFFRASLSHMKHEPGAPQEKDVIYKIERAQTAVREREAEKQQAEVEARSKRIREAFRNGRVEPYRPDEYPPTGHWILQTGKTYYYWLNGTYEGPYVSHEARNAAERDLAPAHHVLDLYTITAKGDIVPKSANTLVSEYGTVIHNVIEDMNTQTSYYDEKERVLVRASCPIRTDLEPEYNSEVAAWFKIIGGDRHHDFLTWVAAITRLDLPCVALFVTGPPGAGKSLLANSLARLWTTSRPTTMEEALSNFNDAMLRCPLVFADETLPKDFRGYARNAELRHFIQATERPLNRKFIPTATIKGAVRVIVAANNEEVLATAENLSMDDIAAITQRYFHRPLSKELVAFLNDVDPRGKGWQYDDVVARHALWLRDNHDWTLSERFIIPPMDAHLHRSLTVRSGARSAVCQWITGFILDPSRFKHDGRSGHLAKVSDNRILVNVRALERCWSLYVPNEECPPAGKLASALSTISTKRVKSRRPDAWKERIWYREIETDIIVAWAEQTGYADQERILEAIQEMSEQDEKEQQEAIN